MIDRNRELEGKVAIITGSARNIGKVTAEELSRAGASVTINARQDKDACEAVAASINAAGGNAIPVMADVTTQEGVDHLVGETVKAFGGVDILILNAATRERRHFTDYKFEIFEKHRSLALDGSFRLGIACVPYMIERGGGSIIGLHGNSAYTAAYTKAPTVKDAMGGMLRGMATDLGEYGITCNMTVVGHFSTDRESGSGDTAEQPISDGGVPMGRRGTPQDMAETIRFLVGPYARYISGQTIHLNGGVLMPH
jgi:3-oxoacyl-[acyl-carrier protein] reductase